MIEWDRLEVVNSKRRSDVVTLVHVGRARHMAPAQAREMGRSSGTESELPPRTLRAGHWCPSNTLSMPGTALQFVHMGEIIADLVVSSISSGG